MVDEDGQTTSAACNYNNESRPVKRKRTWENAVINDTSWKVECNCGDARNKWAPSFNFNPVVSIISFLIILAFVLVCILDTDGASDAFSTAKRWITHKFTWLYIGSQDAWALVIIIIYFSKYGNMKLGKPDEEPEYNDATWFAMLFSCGVGVGLFFYGVAEPIYHYTGANRYSADKYMPDNELAQNAMNLTIYHWGIHGWIVYVLVGILLAFVSFRKGMKMTMKSCFYPLIGDRIFGWMGDAIDILSIITTLFGVCTSLGLGVMQINAGLNFINADILENTQNQVIIIWCITFVATMSVLSGIGLGIRRLSEVCFSLGMLIMVAILFLGDTWYMLNLMVQTVGFYLQWIIQLGFHTDAFEQASPSYGGKSEIGFSDRSRAYADGDSDGGATWMDGWTIFYWGWWISWAPFVGSFIAQISRGRTIREFINGALTAPTLYAILWFSIFGGAGILHERQAAAPSQNLCCASWNVSNTYNDTLLTPTVMAETDYTKWTVVCPEVGGTLTCSPCNLHWMKNFTDSTTTGSKDLSSFVDLLHQRNFRYGMYNEDYTHVKLSCLTSTNMWFALMNTFGDLGYFLCIISLIDLILYFVTSSDSGSLVIDILAANGIPEPPRTQRIFWALCEGATATALLVAGKSDALGALQTASIVTGLPYTIILCFLCISLWRALAMEYGDIDPYGPDFKIAVIDPFAKADCELWGKFFKNIFITPYTIYKVLSKSGSGTGNSMSIAILSGISWLLWIILLICEVKVKGIHAIGWAFFLMFVTCVTVARFKVRNYYGVNGNATEDFFAALFLYPSVSSQLEYAVAPGGKGITSIMPIPKGRSESIQFQNKVSDIPLPSYEDMVKIDKV